MSYASRSLAGELVRLIDKRVLVKLVDGKAYAGRLTSFDQTSLHVVLSDVEGSDGGRYHRVIINGSRISEILVQEQPSFNAEEFASVVSQKLGLRSDVIKVLPDVNAVIIYDRIRVTEAGVEGSGSLAQKVYEIYMEYMESRKKGVK
ncbi:MAG: Lsm family RNA-binding protein [Ignisphaera sp.]|nr:Lsm family RNA-binding protein [Ignisphaera sp.]MCX8168574.1 Lsm family RNA-binding protein [Ignisphaera sp.]MDW8085160.1 Lsm family RNA-binding protein [Ignisphaera sp.]